VLSQARRDGRDETFAWNSREYLRKKCIGKVVISSLDRSCFCAVRQCCRANHVYCCLLFWALLKVIEVRLFLPVARFLQRIGGLGFILCLSPIDQLTVLMM
jgi:hypothetical protein